MSQAMGLGKSWLVALILPISTGLTWSAGEKAIDAPPPPPQLQSGEPLEPEVTIRRTPRESIYEYRRNGVLFLVRVQPRVGPVYHFVDINGDGELDYRPGEPLQHNVNQWILWQWW